MLYRPTEFPQNLFTIERKGQDSRYLTARSAFLEELIKEERVDAVFAHWGHTTGLFEATARVIVVSDRLARNMELRDRANLFTSDIADLKDPLSNLLQQACHRLAESTHAAACSLMPDAVMVARKLGSKWPRIWAFVPQGLLQAFILKCGATAVGMPLDQYTCLPSAKIDQLAEALSHPGKLQVLVPEAPTRLTRGRSPKKDGATVGRDARWYVRHTVGGLSVSTLAREYHEAEHSNLGHYSNCENDRKLIYNAFRNTEDLLNLSSYSV